MTTLSTTDLAAITGGAQSFQQFGDDLKKDLRGRYQHFVCDGAGLLGGEELAKNIYGASTSDDDRIRSAKAITQICNTGTHLPAKAPAFPF